MKKKISALILVFSLSLVLAACGGEADSIVGKWYITRTTGYDETREMYLTFSEDGKVHIDLRSSGSVLLEGEREEEKEKEERHLGGTYSVSAFGTLNLVFNEDDGRRMEDDVQTLKRTSSEQLEMNEYYLSGDTLIWTADVFTRAPVRFTRVR